MPQLSEVVLLLCEIKLCESEYKLKVGMLAGRPLDSLWAERAAVAR